MPHPQPPAAGARCALCTGDGGRRGTRGRGHGAGSGDGTGGCVTCRRGRCREGDGQCQRPRGGGPPAPAFPRTDTAITRPDPASGRARRVPRAGVGPNPRLCGAPARPCHRHGALHTRLSPLGRLPEPSPIRAQVASPGPRHQGVIPPRQRVTFRTAFRHAPSSSSGDWPPRTRTALSVMPAGHAEPPRPGQRAVLTPRGLTPPHKPPGQSLCDGDEALTTPHAGSKHTPREPGPADRFGAYLYSRKPNGPKQTKKRKRQQ